MSDDLISRSALLEDFRNTITEQSDTMDWLNMIERQATAYDVDKVVKQICGCDGCSGCCNCHEEEKWTECEEYARVYEIVKAGGVNE